MPATRTLPLPEIVSTFLKTRSLYLYVGDDSGRLLGVVDLHDIKESLPERDLSALVIAEDLVSEIPSVTPTEALTSVNEKLWFRDLGQLPVVDSPETRRFLGIVTRRDLLGAFDSEVLKHNRLLARVLRDVDTSQPTAAAPLPRAGTILVREWRGVTHHVTITTDGFLWNGKTHQSLSAIARAITGTKWNGPRFFGMRKVKSASEGGDGTQ